MIVARSATRVDLAGGTLDCWPLYLLVDSAITTNISISIFTEVDLTPKSDSTIELSLEDIDFKAKFGDLAELLQASDPRLELVKRHVAHWRPQKGFSLKTRSQSPVGGGLGASSSLSMSLNKAFAQMSEVTLSLTDAIQLSANIEAQVLGKMTGTQDYFAAVAQGLNAIHYSPVGFTLEPIQIDPEFWNQRMTLVYTGQPHHSGLNNWKVIQGALNNDAHTMEHLKELKCIAQDMYAALKGAAWSSLAELFKREFQSRSQLSESFSSPEIERLNEVALKSGAHAAKICGAGGGGCVMIWSEPDAKKGVESACHDHGFRVLKAKVVV